MIVRPMTIADIDAIIEIQNGVFSDAWNKDMMRSAFATNRFFGFCVQDGDVVGYVSLSQNYDDADLETIFLSPKYRGKGISNILMQSAIDECEKKGLKGIFLEVKPSNAFAISLYEKFGFSKISVRKKYYSDGEDCIVMKKELEK